MSEDDLWLKVLVVVGLLFLVFLGFLVLFLMAGQDAKKKAKEKQKGPLNGAHKGGRPVPSPSSQAQI